jgi:hypothetical protein
MHQAFAADGKREICYKSRPDNSHLEHPDERPGWIYSKVSYSYPFLPYRKQRLLQTQQ